MAKDDSKTIKVLLEECQRRIAEGRDKHGLFNSVHEAYGAITEELIELQEEMQGLQCIHRGLQNDMMSDAPLSAQETTAAEGQEAAFHVMLEAMDVYVLFAKHGMCAMERANKYANLPIDDCAVTQEIIN